MDLYSVIITAGGLCDSSLHWTLNTEAGNFIIVVCIIACYYTCVTSSCMSCSKLCRSLCRVLVLAVLHCRARTSGSLRCLSSIWAKTWTKEQKVVQKCCVNVWTVCEGKTMKCLHFSVYKVCRVYAIYVEKAVTEKSEKYISCTRKAKLWLIFIWLLSLTPTNQVCNLCVLRNAHKSWVYKIFLRP